MAKKDKQQEPKTNPKTAPKAPALNKDGKTVTKEPVVKEDANKNIRYVDTVDETKYKKEIRNGEEVWVHRENTPGHPIPATPKLIKTTPMVKKGEPKKPNPPRPSKTEPTELEDVVRMKKKEIKTEIKPTEHKIKGEAEIYRMIDNEKTGMSNGKYTAYNYPDKEGRYTNTAETRYFDRQGNQIDPSKSYDDKGNFVPSIIPGSTLNEGANVGGLTRIMAVGQNGVDKPNADYSGNLMSGEYNITKNNFGGSGVTNYAGAPKTFVMPKYDSLGKEIPSANTGIIYDKAIADKVNAIKGSAGSFKLANQISPEDIKPKEEEVITIPRFKKGGLVGKIKGYYLGTPEGGVEGPSSLSGNPTINSGSFMPSGNKGNFYQNEEFGVVGQNDVYAEQKAKDKEVSDAKKAKNDANARSVANAAGQALGGYGAAYYSSQKPTSEADATRSGAMSAVSQSGAIGGAIGGIAAIGDKIGGKKKLQYEAMDAEGNLLDEGRSKRNAIGGGLLSPSKALAYRSESGNWGDVKGDKYNAFIEGKAKKQIAEVKAANVASKQNQAIAARDAGNFNPTMTDAYDLEGATFGKDQQLILANNQQFDKNRPMMNKGGLVGKVKQMCADGGEIKGKGTAKSDSISAEVEEGSFVVPAVNAELAKGIRKLYLKAPNKKANLNQKEGEEVKLSNGEHLFTPQENEYLESIGINLEELAPNAEHEEEGKANGGLTSSKAKMILHDKSVHGKPLTDQQRKFFGAIASGESVKGYMAGGMIKGYANGTTGDGVKSNGGGKVEKRKHSTGSSYYDKELDNISSKTYKTASDIESDIAKLNDLSDKYKSQYGKYSNEIGDQLRNLHRITPSVKKEQAEATRTSKIDETINSVKKELKSAGATDGQIKEYENSFKGKSNQEREYVLDDARKKVFKELSSKSAIESGAKARNLMTEASKFYRAKEVEAFMNVEKTKKNPENYTIDQIESFKDDLASARQKQEDVASAKEEGGMGLERESDLYNETKNKPSTNSAPTETKVAPEVKSSTEAKAGQEPNLEVKPKSKQSDKTYEELIKKPYDARVTDAQWKKAVDDSIASGATIPKGAVAPTGGTQVTTAKKGMKAPKVPSSVKFVPTLTENNGQDDVIVPGDNLSPNERAKVTALENTEKANAKKLNDSAIAVGNQTVASPPPDKKGWADKLGNIDPTSFVGIGQTAIGLNMLKGEKRPIDRAVIDPAYNANVERSMQDARFGLTPEQRIAADQDIQNALNDAKFQGLNTSGGSGIQAFNTNRAAINDAWRNKLGLQEADTNLRMQKQQYADAQVANRANILAANRRMLFNDTMGAFQQNQQAGGDLISAGLSNTIGAYRFKKDQQAIEEANAQRNGWTTNIGNA
jgi:hypothetical protein